MVAQVELFAPFACVRALVNIRPQGFQAEAKILANTGLDQGRKGKYIDGPGIFRACRAEYVQ